MIVVTVARKPLFKTSIGRNVLENGCGGLDINRSRIASAVLPKECVAPGWDAYNKTNAEQGYRQKEYSVGDAHYTPSADGRRPANLILEHRPDCRIIGKKTVGKGECCPGHY